jgi:hypothetical protein
MKTKRKKARTTPEAALKSLHSVRCANLLALVGEGKRFKTQTDLASALNLTDGSYLSQMVGPKPRRRFTEVIARKWEYKLKLATGALDLAE